MGFSLACPNTTKPRNMRDLLRFLADHMTSSSCEASILQPWFAFIAQHAERDLKDIPSTSRILDESFKSSHCQVPTTNFQVVRPLHQLHVNLDSSWFVEPEKVPALDFLEEGCRGRRLNETVLTVEILPFFEGTLKKAVNSKIMNFSKEDALYTLLGYYSDLLTFEVQCDFLHTDAHPSNLLVYKFSGPLKLAFVDFGTTTSSQQQFANAIGETWDAILSMVEFPQMLRIAEEEKNAPATDDN
eukprot:TRINITY_DN653_c0_g3_i2.p1 TRINITY_DN653_c0_g3~~TRINITY_DN653_c0_g3_i2.p1  ORF type:complete len:243 (-),score=54.74 TRINITY_DN653_c0_g3_i2:331-1059(-)